LFSKGWNGNFSHPPANKKADGSAAVSPSKPADRSRQTMIITSTLSTSDLAVQKDWSPSTTGAPVDLTVPALAYLAGLISKRSRDVQRQALDKQAHLFTGGRVQSCQAFPWHLLRFEHTTALKTKLIELYKPATVNRHLTALRGVLRAAWRVGYMTAEEFHRAADLKSVSCSTLPAGRELTDRELANIFAELRKDTTQAGTRDYAILGLLYGCGLRRAELAALNLADFDREGQSIKVLHGKGQKERMAYPPRFALEAVNAWLIVRGPTPGPLFLPADRHGHIAFRADNLSSQTVYNVLTLRAGAAGIVDISPHDLRRTFVGRLLDAGNDLVTVSKMAGHANVQTTARYDRRPEEVKRKAAQTLTVPVG
jgi:site-specific recombinase XerD